MKALVILVALSLSACATDPTTVQTLVAAQQASNARPTLALECPAGSCKFEYTDPRDRQQLKMPTNGWDAMTSIGNNITSVVPLLVTGQIAISGFNALKSSGAITNTTGAVSTVGATTTLSGTGSLGSGTYSTTANPISTTTPAPVVVTPVTPITPTVINQPVIVPDTVVITPVITGTAP